MPDYLFIVFGFILLFLLSRHLMLFLLGKSFCHELFLLIGAVYYLLVPFWAYQYSLYDDGPGSKLWGKVFHSVFQHSAWYMLFYLLVCAPSYFLSKKIVLINAFPSRYPGEIKFTAATGIFMVIVIVFNVYAVLRVAPFLFAGYTLGYDSSLYGPLCGIFLFVLMNFLFFSDALAVSSQRVLRFWRNISALILLCDAMLLLSLGVRTYVIIGVTSIIAYFVYSNQGVLVNEWVALPRFIGRSSASAILLVVLSAFFLIFLIYIGISRMGLGVGDRLIPYFLAESVLNSISMSGATYDCLGAVGFLLGNPSEVFGAVVNTLPSVFFDKSSLYAPGAECVASPLGGVQITASLLSSFGLLGSGIAVFLFGYWLNFVRKKSFYSNLWLYSYLSGCCVSLIYRDPLSVSIKVSVFYPILFSMLSHCVFPPRRRPASRRVV